MKFLKLLSYPIAFAIVASPGIDRQWMLDTIVNTAKQALGTDDMRIVFTGINVAGHELIFWGLNLVFYLIYKLQIPFFEQFKVQKVWIFDGRVVCFNIRFCRKRGLGKIPIQK
jgi:hypothetical protein